MIRITNLLDLWKYDRMPKYIADSMEKQLIELCREWLVNDIGSFGAFYYVEDTNDLNNYRDTGMTERIETTEPEWITVLFDESGDKCYQMCHIIDDGFAIYVFCEEKNFSGLTP